MKKLILALLSAASMLCVSHFAMAYTPKTEAEMKTECGNKWKTDAQKAEQCLNGKKGYQARMEKQAGKSVKPADKMAAKSPAKALNAPALAPAAAAPAAAPQAK